jgi:hypothetical protein
VRQEVAAVRVGAGLHGLLLVAGQVLERTPAAILKKPLLYSVYVFASNSAGEGLAAQLQVGAQGDVEALDLFGQRLGGVVGAGVGAIGLLLQFLDGGLHVGELVERVGDFSHLGFEVGDGLAFGLRLDQFVVRLLELVEALPWSFDDLLHLEQGHFAGHAAPCWQGKCRPETWRPPAHSLRSSAAPSA